jgi:hypothetical protein
MKIQIKRNSDCREHQHKAVVEVPKRREVSELTLIHLAQFEAANKGPDEHEVDE